MFSSILRQLLLESTHNQHCQNTVSINQQKYVYCSKASSLNQQRLHSNISLTQSRDQLFLNTQSVKATILQIEIQNTKIFSIFGYSTQKLLECSSVEIYVNLTFNIVEGALLCSQCNAYIINSELQFIVQYGIRIAGLILTSISDIVLTNSNLQFRIDAKQISGVVLQTKQQLSVQITEVNISGYFVNSSSVAGNIVAYINNTVTLTSNNFNLCTNKVNYYASLSLITNWITIGTINIECEQICKTSYYTYGLCLQDLKNGQILFNQLVCVNDFIFLNSQCNCKQGFVQNESMCVNPQNYLSNVLLNSTQTNNDIISAFTQLDEYRAQNLSSLESQYASFSTLYNISLQDQFAKSSQVLSDAGIQLNSQINTNKSQSDSNILVNYSMLLNTIQQQVNASKSLIKQANDSVFSNISANMSTFDGNLSDASYTARSTLYDIKYQLFDSIYSTQSDAQDSLDSAQSKLDKQIERIKCIHGDCANIQSVTVTGFGKTFYCSTNAEASHVCDVYEPDRTVTVPGTCQIKKNVATGEFELFVYCCTKQGYWNEVKEECEHISY
ncbi:Hypothetical_protein [Hexamita inflata]|uniref:Hypothetical_protein n=1 Tax=Hexamita inflata TaxID=28002 RepID=A0AA86UYG3_9EUKA|nr:Hypothetical protein HINF_LOCUS60704 [Hexamita inflata]